MRIVFIGTGEIGLPVLRSFLGSAAHQLAGVVTQPDKPVGREQKMTAPPIKTALAGSAIPILQPERIKRPEAVADLRALAPEVIVVMAYGQILPRAVLEIPTLASLNLHASLLPKYRGAAPIQAAIVEGETETGITVMYMDEGLDTGDILLQERLAISPNETGGSLHDRLGEIAPNALRQALAQLAAGTAARIPQNPVEATYAPKLERENGQIDWTETAPVIERKIRAFDPWPGSFTFLRGADGKERKLKIFRAQVSDRPPLNLGEISISGPEFYVGTGDQPLRLDEVQLEGKKRMAAGELIRGHSWLSGASAAI